MARLLDRNRQETRKLHKKSHTIADFHMLV